MPDPSTYRPKPGEIPDEPGVYRFRDPQGRVIYVGKAKSLRQRLANYFQDLSALHPRTTAMVTTAASVEWTVVSTEVEALQLEYSWIKEYDPRFNVKYRDDKSYPYLAVTMGEEVPRVQVVRGPKRKGTRYFGPYTHAWAIRETVDLLLRVFPVRTCSSGVYKRAAASGRPCLLGYIDKCSAPCVGRVSVDEHRALAGDFCDFVAGNTARFVRRTEREMRDAAAELDFERAARLRDDLGALQKALEKSAVVLPDATDADVFAVADDELEAAVQVFHVRGGRVRGQRGWVVEKVEDVGPAELVEQLLLQVYGGESGESVPREVLVPHLPATGEAEVEDWLAELRGSRVDLRVPQRGDKRALMETVQRNAVQALGLHKTRRAGDLTTRSQALQELQEVLGLDEAPLRIECFDVSHTQETNVVASMVVFEDGLPKKGDYRRFSVRGDEGGLDDTRAMREVLTRRFRRARAEEDTGAVLVAGEAEAALEGAAAGAAGPAGRGAAVEVVEVDGEVAPALPGGVDPETGRPRRFAYAPNLVVVDGGRPQVEAAARALADAGVVDVALCGLAKRLEEVWLPGEEHPLVLPRTSQGLFLLQRVRDEAHRFAITYHRAKRSRAMTGSALDGVPGLGKTRRAALLKHFGSVKRLRAATVEEVAAVPGMGPRTAAAVVAALAGAGAGEPAVNTATGEVLD
ncbi:excinuclease ABC subunit UvrC [Paenibacillus sp. TRM 82003]|uniref:excinuclease ABC subunit UvrC n=1 Tax=Kineococcus sp. TRM81007 TaxID=2925831 RepID=UPI001F57B19B|nr:excinuclease ABC subunit UvrC [Kineococcus sp. TRM81007]MCI2237623.1 excinuclease ABC subunit UvrC [Kineococcus sp. TRM81007]MCI3921641.1 excinuclease ABC subunit UvrC [Paenibacillus sp. TRM 82003]